MSTVITVKMSVGNKPDPGIALLLKCVDKIALSHLFPQNTRTFLPSTDPGLVFNFGRAHSTGFTLRFSSRNSYADLQLYEKVE